MILFPTRNRAWALTRFIEQYQLTGATLPVCVIVDEDNLGHYEEAWKEAPAGWILFPNKKIRDLNGAMNSAFEAFPNEPFYGMVADDVVPTTYAWDIKLSEACKPHYIVWGDDGIWGSHRGKPDLPTHPFIGGDLVRAWGWFSPPYTNRHCADFIWMDFAAALGVGKSMPEVIMEHMHWEAGKAKRDMTYALQPSRAEGHEAYHNKYKNSDKFKADLARVKEKLGI